VSARGVQAASPFRRCSRAMALFLRAAMLTAACACLLSCALHDADLSTPDDREAQAAATLDTFIETLNDLDTEAFLRLFEEDASVFLPFADSPTRLNGIAEIRAYIEPFFENTRGAVGGDPPYMHLKPGDAAVAVYGDSALVTFQVVHPAVTSRRTLVLRFREGRYRIAHLHGSNVRPE